MVNKKIDRRVKYTKMVIKDNFIALLKEKPIAKITIKELCERADINRATFYAHYLDTYDLLAQVQNNIITDIIQHLDNQEFRDDREVAPMNATLSLMEYIKDNAQLFDLFLNFKGDLSFQQAVIDIIAKQQFAFMSFQKPILQEHADYLLNFLSSGSVSLVQKWLKDGLKLSPIEITHLILRICSEGRSSFL